EVPTRHGADRRRPVSHGVALTRWLAPLGHEAPQPASGALLAFPLERGPSPEVALVPAHYPSQAGLEGRDAGPELVTVERQSRLEPKRVAGAETGRHDAGVEDRLPERWRHLV